jgi:MoaA/NifB/PqqE/SkfB family radical SAM enzyme
MDIVAVDQRTARGPELVYFGLFDNCNAQCNMCDCWLLPRTALPDKHYEEVLNSVLALEPSAIRFTGGEPLLLASLPRLVAVAAAAGSRVSVISNGRVLRSKLAVLADSGCREIVLSIDAMGGTHDLIRNTPGLFARCVGAIEELRSTDLVYGVNTTVQALGVDDLERLGEMLSGLPKPPTWWHLIPVRGDSRLTPSNEQLQRVRAQLPRIRRGADEAGISVIADESLLPETAARPCNVPSFTAYVRADTGAVSGCNMLAYADSPIGNIFDTPIEQLWSSPDARALRRRCAGGFNADCARCDGGSREMNQFLRALAHSAGRKGGGR